MTFSNRSGDVQLVEETFFPAPPPVWIEPTTRTMGLGDARGRCFRHCRGHHRAQSPLTLAKALVGTTGNAIPGTVSSLAPVLSFSCRFT